MSTKPKVKRLFLVAKFAIYTCAKMDVIFPTIVGSKYFKLWNYAMNKWILILRLHSKVLIQVIFFKLNCAGEAKWKTRTGATKISTVYLSLLTNYKCLQNINRNEWRGTTVGSEEKMIDIMTSTCPILNFTTVCTWDYKIRHLLKVQYKTCK